MAVNLPHDLSLLLVANEQPDEQALRRGLALHRCDEPTLSFSNRFDDAARLLRSQPYDAICCLFDEPLVDYDVHIVQAFRDLASGTPQLLLIPQHNALSAQLLEQEDTLPLVARMFHEQQVLAWLARHLEHSRVAEAHRRRLDQEAQRLEEEYEETVNVLNQQRRFLDRMKSVLGVELEPTALTEGSLGTTASYPQQILSLYEDLLKAHMMSTAELRDEIGQVVEVLQLLNVEPKTVLELHLQTVHKLLNQIGRRGSRHFLSRADVLIINVLVALCEAYRRQSG